ncbi:MAG: alpha/beta hydrolase [Paludibaculum sp.]
MSRVPVIVFCLALSAAWSLCGQPAAPPPSIAPTHADLEYAPAEPASSKGHQLDMYIPSGATRPVPVVIWTAGSAWMADTGKRSGGAMAAQLNPAGYAVAGVSIRSSSQVKFPGQLHDIKAAVRWLRANAAKYNLDPAHIGYHRRRVPEAGPRR